MADVARIVAIRWKQLDQEYLEKWIIELSLKEGWETALKMADVSLPNILPLSCEMRYRLIVGVCVRLDSTVHEITHTPPSLETLHAPFSSLTV